MSKTNFRIFPSERMADNLITFFGLKFLLQMLPLIIFGIGIWNRRRWAVWGAAAICALNLMLLFFTTNAVSAMVVKSEVFIWSILLSSITLLCNGPMGDLLVLIATPILLKHTKKEK